MREYIIAGLLCWIIVCVVDALSGPTTEPTIEDE
jgi:hypothetical protein